MVANPERLLDDYLEAGAAWVSVHVEATAHLDRLLARIRAAGARAGAVLNPATPVGALADCLPALDFVLVMSVNPGFAGQRFIPYALDKVRRLAAMVRAGGAADRDRDRRRHRPRQHRRRRRRRRRDLRRRLGRLRRPRPRRAHARAQATLPQEPSDDELRRHRLAARRRSAPARRRRPRRLQDAARQREDPLLQLSAAESLAEGQRLMGDREVRAGAQVPHPRLRGGAQLRPPAARRCCWSPTRSTSRAARQNLVQAEAKYRDFLNRFPTSDRAAYVQLQIGNSLAGARRAPRPRPERHPRRRSPPSRTCCASTRRASTPPRPGSGSPRCAPSSASTSSRWPASTTATASRSPPRAGSSYLLATYPEYAAKDKVYYYLGLALNHDGQARGGRPVVRQAASGVPAELVRRRHPRLSARRRRASRRGGSLAARRARRLRLGAAAARRAARRPAADARGAGARAGAEGGGAGGRARPPAPAGGGARGAACRPRRRRVGGGSAAAPGASVAGAASGTVAPPVTTPARAPSPLAHDVGGGRPAAPCGPGASTSRATPPARPPPPRRRRRRPSRRASCRSTSRWRRRRRRRAARGAAAPRPAPAPPCPATGRAAAPQRRGGGEGAAGAARGAGRLRRGLHLLPPGQVRRRPRRASRSSWRESPQSELSDNAQYWIGAARFARGDYHGALAAFRRTVERYPDANKVPDALYKMGQAFEELQRGRAGARGLRRAGAALPRHRRRHPGGRAHRRSSRREAPPALPSSILEVRVKPNS